jgi:hypothetical protein
MTANEAQSFGRRMPMPFQTQVLAYGAAARLIDPDQLIEIVFFPMAIIRALSCAWSAA